MRLIDADALIIELMDRGLDHLQTKDFMEINQAVADAPTVDAVPVVHGEWLYDNTSDMFVCSACAGVMVRNVYSYCPWCGSKMDGERKGGDE